MSNAPIKVTDNTFNQDNAPPNFVPSQSLVLYVTLNFSLRFTTTGVGSTSSMGKGGAFAGSKRSSGHGRMCLHSWILLARGQGVGLQALAEVEPRLNCADDVHSQGQAQSQAAPTKATN
ncbi:hypothetical protein BJV74DRAFT_796568 [Russula compacta]|nr:hypothetical protein BJV74DRAFT_796568 [Russula compacta]